MLADKLFDVQENGNHLFEINNLESLIEAVNDWPKATSDLDNYLKQIRNFLKKNNLNFCYS